MPNVVKGSKQQKMVVVPHRPKRRALIIMVALAVVTLSTAGGFLFSYYETMASQQSAQMNRETLSEEIATLELENSELKRQVAILDTSSVMDQRATVEVQETIGSLREQVAQLEQEIVYYRQVVSEETEGTGLIVGQFDIHATREQDHFRYKLVMRQQDADGDSYLVGHVNINLVGSQAEEQLIIPLRDMSEEQDQLDIRLRFKYFQSIEGELALPAEFIPERIQIAAVSVEPVAKSVDQNFSWVVEGE